ncbi:GNAT family N-acetyltransferase [Sulfitobacter albidus]|uniref:GNAT family N-acetyltransferase n=1 Tax=Sulfitobacter albidus TaxID=2829501 RepID=A0A975PNJ0_9RHOB|nr:GNAT family N-acetyltransferase [Sulfitobacter albidus]QUJ77360.1 GNAT family N-acetyltransferase [Sulfitobacter albidus]
MTFTIGPANPTDPAIRALIAAHIAHGDAHYPSESNHHLDVDDYADGKTTLYAAWDGETALGMLGIKPLSGTTAEVKSMHVLAAGRGRGVGTALLAHLLTAARKAGTTQLFLETGSAEASAAARRLYERHGFAYCPPFEGYSPDPNSVFMTRTL